MTRPSRRSLSGIFGKSTEAELARLSRPCTLAPHGITRARALSRSASSLGDVETLDAVSGHVAGLLVLDPEIEGLAFIGPLLGTVGASDDGPLASCLAICGSLERRPCRRAFVVAIGLPGCVLVEGIKSHAFGIDPDLALGRKIGRA